MVFVYLERFIFICFIPWIYIQMTEPTTPTTATTATTATTRGSGYKRERKQTAQILPVGITHNMMKKYVVYYREMTYLKNGKQQPREYFKVEAHPKLNKPWVTSKSVKMTLIEKLNDANTFVDDLDSLDTVDGEDIYPECITASTGVAETIIFRWIKQLPKYATMRIVRNTPTAIILSVNYDRKDNINGFRWTGCRTFSLPMNAILDDGEGEDAAAIDTAISLEIHNLREKLIHKYELDLWGV
jgi:hypothetical protein